MGGGAAIVLLLALVSSGALGLKAPNTEDVNLLQVQGIVLQKEGENHKMELLPKGEIKPLDHTSQIRGAIRAAQESAIAALTPKTPEVPVSTQDQQQTEQKAEEQTEPKPEQQAEQQAEQQSEQPKVELTLSHSVVIDKPATKPEASKKMLQAHPIGTKKAKATQSAKPANAVAKPTVHKQSPPASQITATKVSTISSTSLSAPSPTDDSDPVDFVFTWYNANDAATTKSKEKRYEEWSIAEGSSVSRDAAAPKRFFDAGELKFAIRSAFMYAPWVRTVFLVVGDEQPLPEWLKEKSHRLKVIRHSQIFPDKSDLPTFNSFAIEACLHRIPDLSEHFVYFNDDMFINQPVSKSLFFGSDGKPNIWVNKDSTRFDQVSDGQDAYMTGIFKGKPSTRDDSYVTAIKNSNNLAMETVSQDLFNDEQRKTAYHSLIHECKAMSKSVLEKVENKFESEFTQTRRNPFRSRNDIWSIQLASMVCLLDGSCNRQPNPREMYLSFEYDSSANIFNKIASNKPMFFCLNDAGNKQSVRSIETELQKLFPVPSPAEK